MSAAQHTPGPWLRDRTAGLRCDVRAASGRKIALCFGLADPRKRKGESIEQYRERYEAYRKRCDADAVRIVAAVNACEGIPIEVLEANAAGGLPWSVADQIDQGVLVSKLRAALGQAEDLITNRWGYPNDASSRTSILEEIRAAIDCAKRAAS